MRAPVSNLFQLLELTQTAPHLLDEATRQQQTAHFRQSARDLLDTMEERLAWSKDQLDGLEPVPGTLALAPLLAELTALYAPLAQRKNIELITACPPALHLRTDPNFLRVILRNLVQNALKFTPADGTVRLEAEINPAGRITLRVANTGPGLSSDNARVLGGTGLNAVNVGIGTTTPSASLDVARGTGVNGTAIFRGTTRTSHFNYAAAEDTYIRGGKATSNVLLNDDGGNVGIGTTSVPERLSVAGTMRANINSNNSAVIGANAGTGNGVLGTATTGSGVRGAATSGSSGAPGNYTITITGGTYSNSTHMALATRVGYTPGYITCDESSASSGRLYILTFSPISGFLADAPFSFVVYKP